MPAGNRVAVAQKKEAVAEALDARVVMAAPGPIPRRPRWTVAANWTQHGDDPSALRPSPSYMHTAVTRDGLYEILETAENYGKEEEEEFGGLAVVDRGAWKGVCVLVRARPARPLEEGWVHIVINLDPAHGTTDGAASESGWAAVEIPMDMLRRMAMPYRHRRTFKGTKALRQFLRLPPIEELGLEAWPGRSNEVVEKAQEAAWNEWEREAVASEEKEAEEEAQLLADEEAAAAREMAAEAAAEAAALLAEEEAAEAQEMAVVAAALEEREAEEEAILLAEDEAAEARELAMEEAAQNSRQGY